MEMEKNKVFSDFVGRRVKLVVQEPGDQMPKAIRGHVESINERFLTFRSRQGVGCYNLRFIIAIKPDGGGNG